MRTAISRSRATARLFLSPAMVLVSAAMAVFSGGEAKALIQITSRGALGATDFVDWAQLGTSESNPFSPTSNLGSVLTVDKALPGDFVSLQQGINWIGNFATGEKVLYTTISNPTSNNPIQIFNFPGSGIYAGGVQIEPQAYGSYTARVEAFDVSNTSLGFFDVSGVANGAADDTAAFVGLRNETPFAKIAFSLVSAPSGTIGSFAINRFDFSTQPTSSVPAPLPVLGAGAAFAFSRRLRTRIRRANKV